MKLIVATIVILASIGAISAIKCPTDSSLWCNDAHIAKACEVTKQCSEYVWDVEETRVKDQNIVNFTVYYETLCPDCREFMSGELWKANQSVSDIMKLQIVPYGNAKETWRMVLMSAGEIFFTLALCTFIHAPLITCRSFTAWSPTIKTILKMHRKSVLSSSASRLT